LEILRFKKIEGSEDIQKIRDLFSQLSHFQKNTFQYKAVLEKDNQIRILFEELQSPQSKAEFKLEKIDRLFYVIEAPCLHNEPSSPLKYKSLVPFWSLILVNQKEKDVFFEVSQNLPLIRSNNSIKSDILIEKLRLFFDNVLNRTNILILIQDLKENLICPDNLIIPSFDPKEKEVLIKESIEKPSLKDSNTSKNKSLQSEGVSSRKTGFSRKTLVPKVPIDSQSNNIVNLNLPPKKNYEVPLVYRRYFMIFFGCEKGKVLKSMLLHFFSNFLVQNKNNMYTYLGLYEKEAYILTFNAKEFSIIEADNENSQKFEPLSEEILKHRNPCIELNVFSMNEMNPDALNYFTKHIISAKTNEEIKLICHSLVRKEKVNLPKEITEHLLDEKSKKLFKFRLPDYIENMPVFLIYLKQHFLKKIFTHNTVSQESLIQPALSTLSSSRNLEIRESLDEVNMINGKNSLAKRSIFNFTDPEGIHLEEQIAGGGFSMKNLRKFVQVTMEKSEYCFLFNFLREINGLPNLLEQGFGWCIFLVFINIKSSIYFLLYILLYIFFIFL